MDYNDLLNGYNYIYGTLNASVECISLAKSKSEEMNAVLSTGNSNETRWGEDLICFLDDAQSEVASLRDDLAEFISEFKDMISNSEE